jgi:hypothetical protein
MRNTYWFSAKQGWGRPSSWQGWLVVAAYFGLMAAGPFIFPPYDTPIAYFACATVLPLLFVTVYRLKEEPARLGTGEPQRGWSQASHARTFIVLLAAAILIALAGIAGHYLLASSH